MKEKEINVSKSWADVEAQYQRRADLIPNLVATVKGAAAHEKETLTDVIEARAKATSISIDANNLDAQNMAKFQQAQSGLTQALNKLMVVSERYPDLKANQSFMQLQAQLEGTENRITVARNRYNDSVEAYNYSISSFPRTFYSGLWGHKEKTFFEAEKGAEQAPEVQF
jgi:LemA protein